MAGSRSSRGGSSSASSSRIRRIKKTFNNLKITVLCGFVTVLVLRGTIGVNLGNPRNPTTTPPPPPTTPASSRTSTASSARSAPTKTTTTRGASPLPSPTPPPPPPPPPRELHFRRHCQQLRPRPEDLRLGRPAPALAPPEPWLPLPDPRREPSDPPRHRIPAQPCDNPLGDHYLLKATKNKIDYCRLHGIEIVYNMAHLDRELAGYWAKLPLIRRLMLSHPEVEWIWWMDSDALFTDMAFEIPLSRYGDHNLVIHGYTDLLFDQHSWIALNTGSFLLRNCQWSLDLLDAWAPMGPKGPSATRPGGSSLPI
uniref:Uncharacterized protein n=1 Tax=Ananas comosus var. bracteatus TaxID=296719 RepID=A0A6V7Q142_ANACO|nr:unnamed protein product [Ananas comosus var. bracteatus]